MEKYRKNCGGIVDAAFVVSQVFIRLLADVKKGNVTVHIIVKLFRTQG